MSSEADATTDRKSLSKAFDRLLNQLLRPPPARYMVDSINMFKFINIHNSAQASFTFQTSTDSGSNYNTTITSTVFNTFHREDGSATSLSYQTGDDQAQGTSFQFLYGSSGTQNDNGNSGEIFLFSPSNTTFVKNFFTNFNFMSYHSPAYTQNYRCAGYFNTTSAIDAIQFKMSSGNIDSGVIKMYGLSKS